MNKSEKRGAKYLAKAAPKPRNLKHPVTAYVHYESVGGDLVHFEVKCSAAARYKMAFESRNRPNVIDHWVLDYARKDARLIKLPSQCV
jgi:hypothetical protein